jgi:hypothetical protein
MGNKRVGLARTQALIENLKRSLDFNGATFTDIKISTSQDVTASGTFKLSGDSRTGLEACVHSETIEATSGTTWSSGALKIPAHAVITDVGAVVTSALGFGSGKVGLKAGTAAAGTQIAVLDADALTGTATSLAVGKGTSTIDTLRTALGGASLPVIAADAAYGASARDIHITAVAEDTITGGKIRFWVKYIHIEG